jgi:hypothetical protein
MGDGIDDSNVGDVIAIVDSARPSSSSSGKSGSSGSAIQLRTDYRKPSRRRSFRALCRETSTRFPLDIQAT